MDVVAQRLQRRDVNDLHTLGKRTVQTLAEKPVDAHQKGCQRLARSSRGGQECMPIGGDGRPALPLGIGRGRESIREPTTGDFVQRFEGRIHDITYTNV